MSEKPYKTPVAIFTYNRPVHTARLFESLSHCERLTDCHLTIYCDGVKQPEHAAKVAASRQVVYKWAGQLGADVVERDENLGLTRSIISGVTDLCFRYGRIIVLEDDLVLMPDFLSYMLKALDRYQNEPSVYQISGYMFPVKHRSKLDAFFLPFTTSWGWATWDRAWKVFDEKVPGAASRLADLDFRRRFDLNGSYPHSYLLELLIAGQANTWDIQWWYNVFCQDGLVLHPRQSLVQNYGFDGSGTHCGADLSMKVLHNITNINWLSDPPLFPDKIVVDEKAYKRLQRYFRKTTNLKRPLSLTQHILNRIARLANGVRHES